MVLRNLSSALQRSFAGPAANGAGGRPEALRRHVIGTNARLALTAALVTMPAALFALTQGLVLPFVLAVLGLAVSVFSLGLYQRARHDDAATTQVYGILLCGLVLTIANPGVADFGLAVALLAPVHAALLVPTEIKRRTWIFLGVVSAFAAAGATGLLVWPEAWQPEFGLVGGAAFAVTALIVAHTANRLNAMFEVNEKTQINAYRHLVEHVQDAVLRFAADGTMLFASKSVERVFGCQRYELTAAGLIERMHILDRPAYMTAFAEANGDGRVRQIEVRMRRDDPFAAAPSYIWIEASLSPVIDPDLPTGRHEVVALLRDVTDRKDHDTEMQQARQVAEEASSAKSRFLATIGHELRTPLNAIVGFSEMMTSGIAGDLPAVHREYARLINQSGQHLIEVVKMLLDMSRIEAGRFELQAEPFIPDALIGPCLKIVDPMAREKNVRLMTDIARSLPLLTADERACRQILINLLSNAIKFSEEHSVVTVAMRRDGRHISISVTDEGIGMDAEAVKRIGEPFFQAQDGLARHYEGTGLGLSIVKGLVELHDGTLGATSVPGQGTTMTVLLPINGPATKTDDSDVVTPLQRDSAPAPVPAWQDGRRRAL